MILRNLNRALAGKTRGGFVTCICALLHSDGNTGIANAGHIPPYIGSQPAELENGLPLGVVAEVEYSSAACSVRDTITFLSDGIVEAANQQDELFGFERTSAAIGLGAAVIADAAKAWGQNDDITVVTVRRIA